MATFVRNIMDPDPIAVGEDATVESVIHVTREKELPGVPVVDDGGHWSGSSPSPTS